jgi:hypothetical protein
MSPTQSTSMDAHQLLCHCGCRREQGPFPKDFRHWRRSATALPSQPEDPRASPREKRDDRRCIKDLEQDLRRNEKALAEAAGLLVLPSPQGLEEQPRLHDHAIAPLRQLTRGQRLPARSFLRICLLASFARAREHHGDCVTTLAWWTYDSGAPVVSVIWVDSRFQSQA